jgi:endonuclease/exonuclease/phosphatase family metal-dependent hydrolase
MQRTLAFLVLAGLVLGAWQFFQRYQFKGLENVRVEPRGGAGVAGKASEPTYPIGHTGSTIKVASFNIQIFGRSKIAQASVMRVLCEVARRFDVLAIQEVRARDDGILPRFVQQINTAGRQYDFVIGPRLGRTSNTEQYAYVYDTATVELDRSATYTVADPDDLLHREPLVACFRARGPPANEAFTFTLINVHTDPDEVRGEVDALAGVYRAVRNDGRREDDVIMLGDFNADELSLGRLGESPNIAWAIAGMPTNTRGDRSYDNILFSRVATTEFTGLSGVVNLMSEYKLTLDQAMEVSDHLPIWAEFTTVEGGAAGRFAIRPENGAKTTR